MIIHKQEIIKKYARESEEKILLARVLDKLEETAQKNIPESTRFLNERQQTAVERMLNHLGNPRHFYYGGYEEAQRTVLIFLPDYLEPEQMIQGDQCPLAFVRAEYMSEGVLSHRDFLGSLMGAGIKRESIGDILVSEDRCDFVVLKEILPYLLANFESVGRVKVKTAAISAEMLKVPEEKFVLIKDTVASLRLDNVVSAGFMISREKAGDMVKAGRVALNFSECLKADKSIGQSDIISLRGMGKIMLQEIGHQTKKGRTAIIIKKYM